MTVAQDEDETWSLSFAKKKELFGKSNRIRIGGEKPDGEPEPTTGIFVTIYLWHPMSFKHPICVWLIWSTHLYFLNPINFFRCNYSLVFYFEKTWPILTHVLRYQALGRRCGTSGVSRLSKWGRVLGSIWMIVKRPTEWWDHQSHSNYRS